ncbi:3-(3-hydroxy-phenyl)propionate/3-hydroxycinnamic acid hydroxylase [Streptomyces sp. RB17]|uniref:bifunctional 3-(3-hydroxy-phenyl)propionate/3-hydroxycinnamic acid hydroxylase MhpA n=1 Tax=Streptomyces sp. RB17 TaxID=2585197 RepID=UPI00129702FE|nr:bifunctional 3-(3-hydroxy-phenyl)propionate/3-hydroxycinnamic acid hydroxylase [Streptomyces sp. RB17]MQY40552.1 3-(3-hydroxy-phenyl)propionate/3-hydroxycinnamic acid hydroxylase [Streptomyces sp. RB17]
MSTSTEGLAAETYDVLVVGAGPVGLATAIQLATRGRRVGIVERWPQQYPLPRAVVFDHEAGRILASLGLDMAAVSEPAVDYEWRNGEDQLLLRYDFSDDNYSGWPNLSAFNQPTVEAVLNERVHSLPGIDVLRGWEAVAVQAGPTTVEVTVAESTGDEPLLRDGVRVQRTLRAAYVVGCDGANSLIRSCMHTSVTDLGFKYDWLVLDVMPHDRDRAWTPRNLQVCDPARPTTAVVGGPGRRRWEFMRLPDESIAELLQAETAWKLLEPWDLHPDNATLERQTVYTFQARWADSWRDGRLLLAGDAAHQMPPFAGQGLCSGLRDAINLSWKLDLVLSGKADDSLLDTYTTERCQHLQNAIEKSVMLGRVICEPDPAAAAERDARMIADQQAGRVPQGDQFLVTFTGGLLDRDCTGAAAEPTGQLSRQGRVRFRGRTGMFDETVGIGLTLLTTGDPRDGLDEDTLAWCEQVGLRLLRITDDPAANGPDDVVDLDRTYLSDLARTGIEAMLVRPDFYVFGGAKSTADLPRLVTALRGGLTAAPKRC